MEDESVKITQMFVVIVAVGLIASLFLFMLNEESMYLRSDFNKEEVEMLNQTEKINEIQQNLYNKFYEIVGTGTEGGLLSTVAEGFVISISGLGQIGILIMNGVILLPKIVIDVLQIVLPSEVASIVVSSVYSLIVIFLVVKVVLFVSYTKYFFQHKRYHLYLCQQQRCIANLVEF